MALIDKEQIRAEIERLKDTAWRRADNRYGREDANTYEAWAGAYEKVLEILDTIPEQSVEGLEEAVEGTVCKDESDVWIEIHPDALPNFKDMQPVKLIVKEDVE